MADTLEDILKLREYYMFNTLTTNIRIENI
jgi:hypothetical protein